MYLFRLFDPREKGVDKRWESGGFAVDLRWKGGGSGGKAVDKRWKSGGSV